MRMWGIMINEIRLIRCDELIICFQFLLRLTPVEKGISGGDSISHFIKVFFIYVQVLEVIDLVYFEIIIIIFLSRWRGVIPGRIMEIKRKNGIAFDLMTIGPYFDQGIRVLFHHAVNRGQAYFNPADGHKG